MRSIQTTSMTSVAWQSSSAPASPSGTSIRRTFAHSSLTISSTSAVMPPTRRSLLPTATIVRSQALRLPMLRTVDQKKILRFFASSTFCSRMISRRAICHDVPTRRSSSVRRPMKVKFSYSTRF